MICIKCKKEKSEELFKSQLNLTKLNKCCRPCLDLRKKYSYPKFDNEYKAQWREKNRETIKAYDRAYSKIRKQKRETANE